MKLPRFTQLALVFIIYGKFHQRPLCNIYQSMWQTESTTSIPLPIQEILGHGVRLRNIIKITHFLHYLAQLIFWAITFFGIFVGQYKSLKSLRYHFIKSILNSYSCNIYDITHLKPFQHNTISTNKRMYGWTLVNYRNSQALNVAYVTSENFQKTPILTLRIQLKDQSVLNSSTF